VVSGSGVEKLAFLALQVVKSEDKEVIMRAIASAAGILLGTSTNLTGSTVAPVALTGLEVALSEGAEDARPVTTNFDDETPVSIGELLNACEADADELGAYFGVLFVAGNKRVTNQNRTAFNERRRAAATASIIGEPKIFVQDSPYLAERDCKKSMRRFSRTLQ
jgi:hypothetical protein